MSKIYRVKMKDGDIQRIPARSYEDHGELLVFVPENDGGVKIVKLKRNVERVDEELQGE